MKVFRILDDKTGLYHDGGSMFDRKRWSKRGYFYPTKASARNKIADYIRLLAADTRKYDTATNANIVNAILSVENYRVVEATIEELDTHNPVEKSILSEAAYEGLSRTGVSKKDIDSISILCNRDVNKQE